VIRALEAHEATGISQGELHLRHGFKERAHAGLLLVVCRRRDELYERIAARTEDMLRRGLVEETREVIAASGGDEAPALCTLGYAQAAEFIAGRLSADEMREAIVRETRRFAKRQLTYWRNEPAKRGWIVRPSDGEGAVLAEKQPRVRTARLRPFRVFELSYSALCERARARLDAPFPVNEVWYLSGSAL
jgi:tRNA dimethylallyltransferase